MKHIKKYNESIRDYLKPKSIDEIIKGLDNMTPYGALYKLMSMNDMDLEIPEVSKLIKDRIKKSDEELDKIIDSRKHLTTIVANVARWVEKNGGNRYNVTDYGLLQLGEQIISYSEYNNDVRSMYNESIYDDDVINAFKVLLKKFAICEVKNNNTESEF